MKTEEMKNYKSPVVKVVNVSIQNSILTGSVTGDVDPIEQGPND